MTPIDARCRSRTLVGCLLLAILLAAPAARVPGAEAQESTPPGAPAAMDADVFGRDTPRGAVLGFLGAARAGDEARAAEYLDLHRVPASRRGAAGPSLAARLATVLDQALVIEAETLSDDPAGRRDDGLPPDRERVTTLATKDGDVDVLLQRVSGPGGRPVWKVSAATVAQVPALHERYGDGVLRDILPPVFFDARLLDVALWQWIAVLALVPVAWGVSWVAARAVLHVVAPIVARTPSALDDRLLEILVGPVRLALGLVVFALGALALSLSAAGRRLFLGLLTVAAIMAVTWFLVRAADVLADLAAERLVARGRPAAVTMVPAGRKGAKVVLVGLAVIAALQNLGLNVTGILAGLGIGGLAVALAAQKTVENLFGGVSVIVDQPVRVGDFCRFGDRLGTVEEIGLRSTRIRTLERTIVSVPNAEFAAMQLENFAVRDRIWLHVVLGLRYETTPDQLRHVLVEIRKMLYAHPRVHPDPARIRFVGFGAYSLDLEVFAYVLTGEYGEFLAVREDIYLRIMDIVAAGGTGFAFPSQTTYLSQDAGLDAERGRAAEAAVQGWRAAGERFFPEFAPETIAALDDTLDYPPGRGPTR
jgi:MscS family membrane protein